MSGKRFAVVLLASMTVVLCSTARAGESITFDDGAFGGLKPVSGKWYIEKGKALEMSDYWDEGRPLFATIGRQRTDNLLVSADFEVYDGAGEILICPAWTDRDNYVAAVWKDYDTLRLIQAKNGVETVLAEKRLKDARPPLRLGAAVSGPGLRAYVNGALVLESGAFFQSSNVAALGGRGRLVGFDNVIEEDIEPWETDRSMLSPIEILRPVGRSAFYRMENGANIHLTVGNLSRETLAAVKIRMSVAGFPAIEKTLKDILPEAAATFDCPVPAERLRPDDYFVSVHAMAEGYAPAETRQPFRIVKRPHPQRFPVMLWGSIPPQGAEKLAELGFTHVFAAQVDYKYLWDNPDAVYTVRDDATRAQVFEGIDKAMQAGLHVGASFGPGYFLIYQRPELARVRRDGSHNKERPDICPLLAGSKAFCRRAAETLARTYGSHPAFKFALINTELRDNAQPCFHEEDLRAYREATGQEIPPEVDSKYGVSYKTIEGFPESRVVPDDHPILTYFRWFWREGDGWVAMNDMIHDTLKQGTAAEDFFSWFDPAVRVAPLYGSGGHLPMIGNWSYTYPDPIRVGMPADELINMARGKQKTFQMIQGMWYRTQTAPKELKNNIKRQAVADPWDDHDPEASYITPSPAQFREAFWTAISRPVDMIGYFSLGSLLPGLGGSGDYTHPDTAAVLAEVHAEVLKPFGPLLCELPYRSADVAFLESFASQVFTRQATFGWASGPIGNFWHACEYAGLQSDIVFDESIVEEGLSRYKVLVMSSCGVLTQPVYDKIKAFQEGGGIIIGDEMLVPGIEPDIRIPSINASQRDGKAFKAATLPTATKLREALKGKYSFFVQSENPEVVLHTRERNGVQYIFAVNDKKEFGDYVGQYGLVMENGLPANTTIAVRRTHVRILDLIERVVVAAVEEQGVTRFQATLEPGSGKIFVITDSLPANVAVSAPSTLNRGTAAFFDIAVRNEDGNLVSGAVPFEIEIVDPAFRSAEPSGAYVALNGTARVTFDLAENERTGVWRVTVRESMLGITKTLYVKVR